MCVQNLTRETQSYSYMLKEKEKSTFRLLLHFLPKIITAQKSKQQSVMIYPPGMILFFQVHCHLLMNKCRLVGLLIFSQTLFDIEIDIDIDNTLTLKFTLFLLGNFRKCP